LPPSPCGTFREGLVRLEWAQTVPIYHMRPYFDERHHLNLSQDALWLLQLWFCHYLGLPLRDDDQELLEDYRATKLQQMEALLSTK